jgi:hypothetical protein
MRKPSHRTDRTLVPDLVVIALVCCVTVNAAEVLLGPQIVACFCPVYPNPCPCAHKPSPYVPVPVVAFVQMYPVLSIALLVISVLVAVVGFSLARETPRRLPATVIQVLQFCPLITLVMVGLVASILAVTLWTPLA